MTDFSTSRSSVDPLAVMIPAPPSDVIAEFTAGLPEDIREALGLVPYVGRDGRGRPVTRRPIWADSSVEGSPGRGWQ